MRTNQGLRAALHVTRENGYYHVPKRDLVSSVKMLFGKKELKIAAGLPFGAELLEELRNFRVKVNPQTGHDSYEAWRERDKDDLVLAVAFACWYALYQKKHEPPIVGPPPGLTRRSPWKIY